jgi:hypothetical protein
MNRSVKLYTDDLAERLKTRVSQPYQPSNGFEGDLFMRDWCAMCQRDAAFRANPDDADGCEIVAMTMALKVNDPDYPREWQYAADGQPICTAFEAS